MYPGGNNFNFQQAFGAMLGAQGRAPQKKQTTKVVTGSGCLFKVSKSLLKDDRPELVTVTKCGSKGTVGQTVDQCGWLNHWKQPWNSKKERLEYHVALHEAHGKCLVQLFAHAPAFNVALAFNFYRRLHLCWTPDKYDQRIPAEDDIIRMHGGLGIAHPFLGPQCKNHVTMDLLHGAVEQNQVDFLRALLHALTNDERSGKGDTHEEVASTNAKGAKKKKRVVPKKCKIMNALRNEDAPSAVDTACQLGHTACLEAFFEFGAIKLERQSKLLSLVVDGDHHEAARCLIAHGASPIAPFNLGMIHVAPIHRATSAAMVRTLIGGLSSVAQRREEANQPDANGRSPLFTATMSGREVEVLEALLEFGANPAKKTQHNNTLLHAACNATGNNKSLLEFWLSRREELKVQLDQEDNYGWTPLAMTKDGECARMLLKAGARVDHVSRVHGLTALINACHQGSTDLVEALLEKGADTEIVGNQQTPIFKATMDGHEGIVKLLLKHGARTDFTLQGMTLLHVAGSFEIAQLLLHEGLDVDAKDARGATPLRSALERNVNPKIAMMLLIAGADDRILDNAGVSAARYIGRTPLAQQYLELKKKVRKAQLGNCPTTLTLVLNIPSRSEVQTIQVPDNCTVESLLGGVRQDVELSGLDLSLLGSTLVFNGRTLTDSPQDELTSFGVKDGSELMVTSLTEEGEEENGGDQSKTAHVDPSAPSTEEPAAAATAGGSNSVSATSNFSFGKSGEKPAAPAASPFGGNGRNVKKSSGSGGGGFSFGGSGFSFKPPGKDE